MSKESLEANPIWHKKRFAVLERDNFRCALCGDDRTELTIYFKEQPGLKPWEHPEESMITLCKCCNAFARANEKIQGFRIDQIRAVHAKIPGQPYVIRMYRMDETTLLYLFNQDNKIATSYNLSGATKELCEFLK